MPARLGTTQEVTDLCTAAKEAGYTVERTAETARIFDGETIVYQGIKKGSADAWIVRFNAAIFAHREEVFHA